MDVVEKSKGQRPGTTTRIATEDGVKVEEITLDSVINSIQSSEPFKKLTKLLDTNHDGWNQGPMSHRVRFSDIGEVIRVAIFFSVDRHESYSAKETSIAQSCTELLRCLSIQPYGIRIVAPLYWLHIESAEPLPLSKDVSIRAVNSVDRSNAKGNQITIEDTLEDYGAVLESIIESNRTRLDWYRLQQISYATASKFTLIASCLRVFTCGLPHVRFITNEQIGRLPEERSTSTTVLGTGDVRLISSRLIGSPELTVHGGVGRSTKRVSHLTDDRLEDLPVFVKLFLRAMKKDFFSRATRRFDRALMSWDPEDIFTDLVLALESLLGGSMDDVRYRAASLVGTSKEERIKVYDFLGLVYSQRNPIMHGSKAFGLKFIKKLKKSYGDTCDISWFLNELTTLVRHCLRLATLSEKMLHDSWAKDLTNNLLQSVDNSGLVERIPSWMGVEFPLFMSNHM